VKDKEKYPIEHSTLNYVKGNATYNVNVRN